MFGWLFGRKKAKPLQWYEQQEQRIAAGAVGIQSARNTTIKQDTNMTTHATLVRAKREREEKARQERIKADAERTRKLRIAEEEETARRRRRDDNNDIGSFVAGAVVGALLNSGGSSSRSDDSWGSSSSSSSSSDNNSWSSSDSFSSGGDSGGGGGGGDF